MLYSWREFFNYYKMNEKGLYPEDYQDDWTEEEKKELLLLSGYEEPIEDVNQAYAEYIYKTSGRIIGDYKPPTEQGGNIE